MSFDLLAPHYRWMELLLAGEKLHRCRIHFLDRIAPPEKILLLGEGHGRALVECRQRFPRAHLTCVDASSRMLTQARHQLHRHHLSTQRIDFIHTDILTWSPPANTFDLVISNFFLDCFTPHQLAQIIPTIARSATPQADWLLADFQAPARGLRRLRARLILQLMYTFFRVATRLPAHTLTAPDSHLTSAGFTLRARTESEWGLLHTDWWQRDSTTEP